MEKIFDIAKDSEKSQSVNESETLMKCQHYTQLKNS